MKIPNSSRAEILSPGPSLSSFGPRPIFFFLPLFLFFSLSACFPFHSFIRHSAHPLPLAYFTLPLSLPARPHPSDLLLLHPTFFFLAPPPLSRRKLINVARFPLFLARSRSLKTPTHTAFTQAVSPQVNAHFHCFITHNRHTLVAISPPLCPLTLKKGSTRTPFSHSSLHRKRSSPSPSHHWNLRFPLPTSKNRCHRFRCHLRSNATFIHTIGFTSSCFTPCSRLHHHRRPKRATSSSSADFDLLRQPA